MGIISLVYSIVFFITMISINLFWCKCCKELVDEQYESDMKMIEEHYEECKEYINQIYELRRKNIILEEEIKELSGE